MNNNVSTVSEVLIADDHRLILEMVDIALTSAPDIALTTVSSVEGVVELLDQGRKFDLILLDWDMSGMHGAETVTEVRERNGGRPVGIFTGNATQRIIDDMSANGAAGVIPKTTSMRSLVNAIRFMAAGERYFPLELMQEQMSVRSSIPSPFSERETAVLNQLADGKPNREIGEILKLADPTVKMHVKSICRKLGVSNRTQAVIAARNLKLI